MARNKSAPDLSSIMAACRRAGFRLTHQRLEILSELARSTDHPSAETLCQRLRKRIPTLSLDTVYRTLATFNHCGLVQKVETPESQARFEAIHEHHHHLICRICHDIVDFNWSSIDHVVLPKEASDWGRIECRNVVVSGVCRNCPPSETPGNPAAETGSDQKKNGKPINKKT